ncbi:MAG: EamA family transporter [Chloroflexi bacterium]|nr:EamA family transporter [Chloroflexota bacterium]
MPPLAMALALGAALLHASWNLALARSRDPQLVTAIGMLAGSLLLLPVALLDWRVGLEAWPFIALSAVLELVYFIALAAAYQRADLSLVYPVSRGVAPVLVLVVSALLLGVATSAGQVAGVVLVAAGVLLVRGVARVGHAEARHLGLALAIGGLIASYTLVDKEGLRFASPIAYLVLIILPAALGYLLVLWRIRGGPAIRAAFGPVPAVGGVAIVGAYGLVLMALSLAPAAAVSATRESSVVIATLLAGPLLGERVGARRILGAVVVVAGIAALAAARTG